VKSAVQTATQRDVASGATPEMAQRGEATDEYSRMSLMFEVSRSKSTVLSSS